MEAQKKIYEQIKKNSDFKLFCYFKPEFQKVNESSGEVIKKWSWTGIYLQQEFLKKYGIELSELGAMRYKLKLHKNHFEKVLIFDKRPEAKIECILEWVPGLTIANEKIKELFKDCLI